MDGRSIDAPGVWWAACIVVVLGLLLMPAGAQAATAPVITHGPVISGTPQVGAQLAASAQWTGDPQPVVAWAWLRCPKPTGSCAVIAGATTAQYRLVTLDVGSVLRARLTLKNDAGSVEARSQPTAVITAAPVPTATPTPTPTPTPTSTPTPVAPPAPTPTATPAPPSPTPVPAPAAAPIVPASTAPPAVARPLRPFPVVRIRGVFTATGARVTLLSVRAPRAALITVLCRGRSCPTRRFKAPPGTRRLRTFERELRAGTRLEVRVTREGYIGKRTVIVIRRQAVPWRSDRCLDPNSTRPVRCT